VVEPLKAGKQQVPGWVGKETSRKGCIQLGRGAIRGKWHTRENKEKEESFRNCPIETLACGGQMSQWEHFLGKKAGWGGTARASKKKEGRERAAGEMVPQNKVRHG